MKSKKIFIYVIVILLGILIFSPIAKHFIAKVSYSNQLSEIERLDRETFLKKAIQISGYDFGNFLAQNKRRELESGEIIQSSDDDIEMIQDESRFKFIENGEFKTLNKTYITENITHPERETANRPDHIYELIKGVKTPINVPGNTDAGFRSSFAYFLAHRPIKFIASNKQSDFIVIENFVNYFIVQEDGKVYYFDSTTVPFADRTDR